MMSGLVNVEKIKDIIENKGIFKYAALYGTDGMSPFDRGFILALNEILNDLKYIEKIDL